MSDRPSSRTSHGERRAREHTEALELHVAASRQQQAGMVPVAVQSLCTPGCLPLPCETSVPPLFATSPHLTA